MKKQLILYFIIIISQVEIFSQEEINCAQNRMKDYVLDGQPYQLILKGSDRGKVYFSFFDAFTYRVAVCSNTHKKYNIAIYDIQKKILFSGSCVDYTKVLDMNFKSNIAGYMEIICNEQNNIEPVFQIMIGFKELTSQQNISKKE